MYVRPVLEEANFDKANYVGNKRRLAKYIVEKFPEGAKTLFDPMCGCSAVLIEAAKRGLQVKANDLSPTPYWYSKGVFEGSRLSEDDIERLKQAKPLEGWLTSEWKGIYPRPPQVRRFLDGLAKAVRDFSGAKGWAAKAALSRILQTMYADSGSGYATRKYESIPAIRGLIDHAVKEINGFIGEVAGKGTRWAGLLPVLACFDWRLDRVREEVAVIAYHFHWSRAECMGLGKSERAAWLGEIRKINKEIARSLKGRKK